MRGWTRLAWGLVGLGLFLWLGYEDTSARTVLILAGFLCLTIGMALIARTYTLEGGADQQVSALRSVLAAGLLGAAVGPVAALLMVVKTGLHSHIPADFTIEDVLNVFQLIPVWALAGAMTGLTWWIGARAAGSHDGR